MSSPHRVHHDLYRGPKVISDPKNGGTIIVNKDLQICEMTSVGAAETRTLAAPTKAGIRFVLRMYADGGDIVVTAAAGFNAALETTATFADAGDLLSLISVTRDSTTYPFRWQTLGGQVGVGIATSSASATTTSSASVSISKSTTASSSKSKSTTASSTKSVSVSTSATATVTATGSGTKTNSPTGTTTSTATATGTSTSTATDTSTATGTATDTSTATSTSTQTPTPSASATGTQ